MTVRGYGAIRGYGGIRSCFEGARRTMTIRGYGADRAYGSIPVVTGRGYVITLPWRSFC